MSAFPTIGPNHTDFWLDFWNEEVKAYMEGLGSGNTSGWPTPFTRNGRIVDLEDDVLQPTFAASPGLTIVLPNGSKWILGGVYHVLDDDLELPQITPNFTGWIEPTATYDEDSEAYIWDIIEHETRPELGTGVAAYVVAGALQVDEIETTEDKVDLIPTLPLVLKRIRDASGGVVQVEYLSQIKYSPADPRTATVVIEEKLQTLLDAIEAGGERLAPTDTDQLWELVLGLSRSIREVAPQTLRFMNVGTARPGIYGTSTSEDSEVFDLGGTLPENAEERNYGV